MSWIEIIEVCVGYFFIYGFLILISYADFDEIPCKSHIKKFILSLVILLIILGIIFGNINININFEIK